jgi:hypothetical protein
LIWRWCRRDWDRAMDARSFSDWLDEFLRKECSFLVSGTSLTLFRSSSTVSFKRCLEGVVCETVFRDSI